MNDNKNLRVLYIGEIVGKIGVFTVKKLLPKIRHDYNIDFVIANANSATGGSGIGKVHSIYLRKLSIDVLTTGEAAFFKKDIVEAFPKSPWLLRPLNFPPGLAPGRGYKTYITEKGPVLVTQLLGQSGYQRIHLDNPFNVFDAVYEKFRLESKRIIVDFRAPTTAEKRAFFKHVDGRASVIFGSYAKAITADAMVSSDGTAYITDSGRTGSLMSVGGMDADTKIQEYLSGIPVWAKEASVSPELQACIAEIMPDGKALSIETIRIPYQGEYNEGTRCSSQS